MSRRETAFEIGAGLEPSDVLNGLAAGLSLRRGAPAHRRMTYYDTFDGRVERSGGAVSLVSDAGGKRIAWQPSDAAAVEGAASAPPAFARDLPAGRLGDAVAGIIEMRRLLPLVEVELHEQALDVLDDERKTVARLCFEEGRAREPGGARAWRVLPSLVRVRSVRGYDGHFEALAQALRARGLASVPSETWRLAAEAIERELGRDRSKFDVPLEASMRTDAGLKRIHLALLEIVIAHEHGVRADLDSEFLHDFRVAVRRTRALLGQVKQVFPEGQLKKFRAGFAWLGGVTGPCRDLDVFLLQFEDLEPQSPLIELRERLGELKRGEHAKLARALSSARYRRLLRDWRVFLETPAPQADAPANAAEPLLRVIEKRVLKLHKKIVRLRDADSGKDIHRLRLACKKLRYLLDCTRSLYAREAYDGAVRPLKKLQDLLGDYNDIEVQTARLSELGEQLAGSFQAATLMAMGGLIESRRADAQALRKRMKSRIDCFCEPHGTHHLERMFAAARESSP